MSISENIRFRAIGLLSSFRDHCQQNDLPLTKSSAANLKSSGNGNYAAGNEVERVGESVLASAGRGLFGESDRQRSQRLPQDASPHTPSTVSEYVPGSEDDAQIDMDSLLAWLNHRFSGSGVSLTTAKCYRRWLASYFDALGHSESAVVRNWIPPCSPEAELASDQQDAAYLAAKSFDPAVGDVQSSDESSPGNSRYLSFLDRQSLGFLLEQLLGETRAGKPRYQSGPEAALMFTVTMMTGLRPHEWPTARYLETFFDPETKLTLGPVLEVHTLKQSNRREDNPLREKRYLVLDEWDEQQLSQLKALLAHVYHAEASEGGFDSFYNSARMTLSRAWKRAQKAMKHGTNEAANGSRALFSAHDDHHHASTPESSASELGAGIATDIEYGALMGDKRTVSFYTARHIFAEEIRRSVSLTRFELAAMLGHSLLTNQVYYGPRQEKREREYDFTLPRPWPGDADEIKLWDYKVNPLRTAYMQGDLFGGMPDETKSLGVDREADGASGFYLR